jgi:hypothetical protein
MPFTDREPLTHSPDGYQQGIFRQAICHEMRLRDMFWGRADLSYAALVAMIFNRLTLSFVLLVTLALFAADPHGFRQSMSPPAALVVWLCAASVVVAMKMVTFGVATMVVWKWPQIPVFLPVLSAFDFLVAIRVGEQVAVAASGNVYVPNVLDSYFYYLFTLLVIETFFVRYLMPEIIAEQTPKARPATAPPPARAAFDTPADLPDMLNIAGRNLRLDEIRYVVSEEHYVRVVMRREEILHRAKLADIISQTAAHHGFQPHRSWWICRHARPRLVKDGSTARIALPGGVSAPVARARFKDVQDWFDSHANW